MNESRFAEFYQSLQDEDLLEIGEDWPSLVDEAKLALREEFARRGLPFDAPALVDPAEDVEYRDLVTIRQYRDLSEAIVARGVLESAGIFCFLKDENFIRLDWQMSNLVGGIRLQVSAKDVEAAEEVLLQPIPEAIAVPDQPLFDQPHCPRCGSMEISWERQGRKAALVSLYLFSLPLPRGSESWRCSNCGLQWVEEHPLQAGEDEEES
jgi:hypothetical protein